MWAVKVHFIAEKIVKKLIGRMAMKIFVKEVEVQGNQSSDFALNFYLMEFRAL